MVPKNYAQIRFYIRYVQTSGVRQALRQKARQRKLDLNFACRQHARDVIKYRNTRRRMNPTSQSGITMYI